MTATGPSESGKRAARGKDNDLKFEDWHRRQAANAPFLQFNQEAKRPPVNLYRRWRSQSTAIDVSTRYQVLNMGETCEKGRNVCVCYMTEHPLGH